MTSIPQIISQRAVGEWAVQSRYAYENPFTDVAVTATFRSPSGKTFTLPGFYDGENTWRVRFNPDEAGEWTYRLLAYPANPDLTFEGSFAVRPGQSRGFLRATPGQAWGFHYESGEPAFLLGDTVYNLFGMAYCGADVASFLQRRAAQGFNLLRIRLPVSPFHPPDGYSAWQTKRTWPWGGSEQSPRFDRFNLDYFRTVDEVVREAERLGLGIEMIMEAWGFEFPFNSRQIFTPEWEELWLRYLIARYDAFTCVYFWTPLNEYEYYPNGDWHYKPVADRWAMRIARWIKGVAQHGHIISIHNGPREPAFARRFAADPEAIETIMFQEWGTRDEANGWLAAGIETQIQRSLEGWRGAAIFAEYGYERNPDLPLLIPSHRYCDPEHTRRGAWRGAFCGLNVIHGFDNSWGPFQVLDQDQPGLVYLLHLRHFFTEVVPFAQLQPAPEIITPPEVIPPQGHQPLALATGAGTERPRRGKGERDLVTVYLPVGGSVALALASAQYPNAHWFDPRTAQHQPAAPAGQNETLHPPTGSTTLQVVPVGTTRFTAPGGSDPAGHPWDWVLVLQGR